MSGHSKWSSIKRKKAVIDAKRGRIFTKLIREITVATRLGGGDEEANSRLRQGILIAKEANMPADNIKRAILRGTGELPGIVYEEAVFEGYGPGGVAIYLEVMTDNRKRTVAEIRHLMTRFGGNLGESGCVSWMFEKKGLITIEKNNVTEDDLLETVINSGGDDFSEEEDVFEIEMPPEKLHNVRSQLESDGFKVLTAEVVMIPQNTVNVEGDSVGSLLKLMNALEEHDDVHSISANFNIDDDVLEGME